MKRIFCILIFIVAAFNNAFAVKYDFNQQTGGVDLCWQYDDMCGIYTPSNTEIIHWVTDGGSNFCSLSAYGWSLETNSNYYAYNPYSPNYKSQGCLMRSLPISYAAQSQSDNNSLNHIANYDYMTAQGKSTSSACHFEFTHIGSILRIECKVPSTKSLKNITLSSDKADFVTAGTMNVVNGTLTPSTFDSSMVLKLDGMTITGGNNLVAYMMLPSVDLTDALLTLTLTATDETVSSVELVGTCVLPGYVYPISLDMPPFRSDKPNAVKSRVCSESKMSKTLIQHPATVLAIACPTASTPNFRVDSDHRFELRPEIDIATTIDSRYGDTFQSQSTHAISGVQVLASTKGTLLIQNGKKYIVK